ncbi:hypothetical protein LIA77_06961 [Sarocladium implicatum]|nr:hypothetical protein LIA77_06961 [Sarocladium implicatum]
MGVVRHHFGLLDDSFRLRNCDPTKHSLQTSIEIENSIWYGGGGKIPYPKHVWSPAGGWYGQPANWRANTVIAGLAITGLVAATWKFSANRETWARKPEPWEWHPSRLWSKQLIEFDKEDKKQ